MARVEPPDVPVASRLIVVPGPAGGVMTTVMVPAVSLRNRTVEPRTAPAVGGWNPQPRMPGVTATTNEDGRATVVVVDDVDAVVTVELTATVVAAGTVVTGLVVGTTVRTGALEPIDGTVSGGGRVVVGSTDVDVDVGGGDVDDVA